MLECNDDIRNDGGRTESMEMKDYSDEENDFVMPGEVFSNSDGSSKKGGDKKSCSLRNKKEKSTRKLLLTSGKIKKRSLRKEDAGPSVKPSKCLANKLGRKYSKVPNRDEEEVAELEGARKVKTKVKRVRTYGNYIQKKFSPTIMSDVIGGLSEEQKRWVRDTGFGELLKFRMLHYTHQLGYNVVKAFNSEKCTLELDAGIIQIDDKTVEKVLGLPRGAKEIVFDETNESISEWGAQFQGCKGCLITPRMLRDKIIGSKMVDKQFKMNFLVMLYNFFIEGNQSRYLIRDVLKSGLDINDCGKYNWCQLLVDKLKKTHMFWAGDKKRNFTGALPFLIYLYVSKVMNKNIVYVSPSFPAFHAWSDMLLRERQKYEEKEDCFGVGDLVELEPVVLKGEGITVAVGPVNQSEHDVDENIEHDSLESVEKSEKEDDELDEMIVEDSLQMSENIYDDVAEVDIDVDMNVNDMDEEEHTPIEELVLVQNRSEKIEEIKCIEVERNVKIEKQATFYKREILEGCTDSDLEKRITVGTNNNHNKEAYKEGNATEGTQSNVDDLIEKHFEEDFGPLNMSVAKGDIHADLKRKAVFDDNMDVVLEMISRVHKRIYDVKDFDMMLTWSGNKLSGVIKKNVAAMVKGKMIVE
uniref:Uncharacterized protein n=1 Tax=Daucus carota subsp. sativus TaxID=79200 RepID=A0A166GUD5_DAUCS